MLIAAALPRPGLGMLFIPRRAYAFGERGPLTHVGSGFCIAVIGGVAEVVDTRPGVCPDDGVGGAMHPCQRFRRILVGARLSCAGAVVSIRQARPAFALRPCWGGPSTVSGRLRARIAVREAGAARTISACASRSGLGRVGARPEVGKARTTIATRCPGRLRGSLRLRRSIGTVVAVRQARATGALRDRRGGGGKREYGEKRESNRCFHCPFPAMDERERVRATPMYERRYQFP